MTSIGVTTATASVTPAARPAGKKLALRSFLFDLAIQPLKLKLSSWEFGAQSSYSRPWRLRSQHTQESSPRAHDASLLIGHQLLIRLKRSESNRHLWDDTGGDGSESLVETQWSLTLDDLGAGGDEATGFHLEVN